MSSKQYYTQEGLDNLKEELHRLKTIELPAVIKQVATAREKGDLKENAEYHAAKDAQGFLVAKIGKLNDDLSRAEVLDRSKVDRDRVSILSTVEVKNIKNGATITYTLVSEKEVNLKSRKISVASPIGKGLLGKRQGDRVEINIPAGKIELEVIAVS